MYVSLAHYNVRVLALLYYDYNVIRNGPSIRANNYNYIAGSAKGGYIWDRIYG